MSRATFQGIRAGDRVRYWAPNGLTVVNGKACPEYRPRVGRAQALLLFPDHVVIDTGGRFGRPAVVNQHNYISHSAG